MARAYEVYADSRQLTHDEWLSNRRTGIGGSDAGAIMGVHPSKGPYGVWAEKAGYDMAVEDNEAMRQGRDLEEYVAQRFTEKTGLKVQREYGMLRSKAHPCMVANIDRKIRGERAGLECKTSRDIYMKRYRGGDFPMEYYCQCLHYLAVTGWDAWYLCVVVYGTDVLVFKLCREEVQDDIDALIEAEEAFWRDYVEGGQIPPPDGLRSTTEALGKVWAQSEDYAIESTPEDEMLIEQLISYKAQRRAADAAIRKLENQIKARMQDAEELRGTTALVTWKPSKRRTISEKLIREKYPDVDIGSIMEESETRRFMIREDDDDEV